MSSEDDKSCAVCGNSDNLLRCSRCKLAYYCSKEHQKQHWKKHKTSCEGIRSKSDARVQKAALIAQPTTPTGKDQPSSSSKTPTLSPSEFTPQEIPLSHQSSSAVEKLNTILKNLSLDKQSKSNMPVTQQQQYKVYPKGYAHSNVPRLENATSVEAMIAVITEDLNNHGLCVLDNFCGAQLGKAALQEVLTMYQKGIFQDGELVAKSNNDAQSIRSDKIMWVEGKEEFCQKIGEILEKIDLLVTLANKQAIKLKLGKLGRYNINGRTKAMLAVYPGSGTHYVKHVDNPNHDGRCVTAIYYLNLNWDVNKSGGILRIFPEKEASSVAEIAPLFDRLIFFWSDRQNPHEVLPCRDTRYAITLWYYDAAERTRYEFQQKIKKLGKILSSGNCDREEVKRKIREQSVKLEEFEKSLLAKRQAPL